LRFARVKQRVMFADDADRPSMHRNETRLHVTKTATGRLQCAGQAVHVAIAALLILPPIKQENA
jgi:hypothetical protein